MNFYKKLKIENDINLIKFASNKQSQSIMDILMQMPNLLNQIKINKDSSSQLYRIWGNPDNQLSKTALKIPHGLSRYKIDQMIKDGFVRLAGGQLNLTQKGVQTIKTMVLGDPSSAFDKPDENLTYHQALSNTKNIKTAKKTKN